MALRKEKELKLHCYEIKVIRHFMLKMNMGRNRSNFDLKKRLSVSSGNRRKGGTI